MITHPTLATAVSKLAEKALNSALAYDPATAAQLQRHEGRCISLSLTNPTVELSITFNGGYIFVASQADENADCHLAGEAKGLMKLLSGPKTSLAGSELRLSGQTGFLMDLLELAKHLDIDWEAMMADTLAKATSQKTADILSHLLATELSAKAQKVRYMADRSPDFFRDLLTEELRATPSQHELNNFNREVDQITMSVERASAKIAALKKKLQSKTSI